MNKRTTFTTLSLAALAAFTVAGLTAGFAAASGNGGPCPPDCTGTGNMVLHQGITVGPTGNWADPIRYAQWCKKEGATTTYTDGKTAWLGYTVRACLVEVDPCPEPCSQELEAILQAHACGEMDTAGTVALGTPTDQGSLISVPMEISFVAFGLDPGWIRVRLGKPGVYMHEQVHVATPPRITHLIEEIVGVMTPVLFTMEISIQDDACAASQDLFVGETENYNLVLRRCPNGPPKAAIAPYPNVPTVSCN